MRPIYESEGDREREAQVAATYAQVMGLDAQAMPRNAPYDYEMRENGRLVAIVEIKCRTVQHDPYWISHSKMVTFHCEAHHRSVAGILIVRWPNMTGWVAVDQLDPESWTTVISGRTDRNDPKDIEKMAEFPLAWFTMMENPLDRLARLDEEVGF
jgi:hypothetical protein